MASLLDLLGGSQDGLPWQQIFGPSWDYDPLAHSLVRAANAARWMQEHHWEQALPREERERQERAGRAEMQARLRARIEAMQQRLARAQAMLAEIGITEDHPLYRQFLQMALAELDAGPWPASGYRTGAPSAIQDIAQLLWGGGWA